jgi:hypothetical protein
VGEAALTALNVTMLGRREFVIATAKAALRTTASDKETEAAASSASDAPATAEVIEEIAVDGVLSVHEARRRLEGRQLLQQIEGSLLIDFDESSEAALPPPSVDEGTLLIDFDQSGATALPPSVETALPPSVELHAPPRPHPTNDVRWAAVD